MKVEVNRLPRMTLKQFMQKNDLTLVVNELRQCLWRARLKGVEIKDGCGLIGFYGHGDTADEAVRCYVRGIQGKRLVYHASGDDRKEINCPILSDANWEEEKWLG